MIGPPLHDHLIIAGVLDFRAKETTCIRVTQDASLRRHSSHIEPRASRKGRAHQGAHAKHDLVFWRKPVRMCGYLVPQPPDVEAPCPEVHPRQALLGRVTRHSAVRQACSQRISTIAVHLDYSNVLSADVTACFRLASACAPVRVYWIAPVAHRATQAGSPPHKSQIKATPVLGWSAAMPNGHASTQAEHPMQSASQTNTAFVISSRYSAPLGHAVMQGARLHCLHTCG